MCGCGDLKYAGKNHGHSQYVTTKELNQVLGSYLTGEEVLDYLAANYYTKSEVDDLIAAIPTEAIGTIKIWPSNTIPDGWLLCDGEYYGDGNGHPLEYPDLFAVIGYTFDKDFDDGFYNVPDLEGRVVVGRDDADFAFDSLGELAGSKTHTLTKSEMPSHNHTIDVDTTTTNATGSSGAGRISATVPMGRVNPGTGINVTTSIQDTGSDQPHNNLQPYMVVNFIIKAKAPQTT